MDRKDIPLKQFSYGPANLRDDWLLLSVGDFASGDYNAMTISWGSVGQIWGKLFFQVAVRPTRYSYDLIERFDTFTLCALPSALKPALSLLGSKSRRDGDKIAESALTPIACASSSAPGFAEAELIVECRKMYWQDIDPSHFLQADIDTHYAKKDYHRVYFGEILRASGTEKYRLAAE